MCIHDLGKDMKASFNLLPKSQVSQPNSDCFSQRGFLYSFTLEDPTGSVGQKSSPWEAGVAPSSLRIPQPGCNTPLKVSKHACPRSPGGWPSGWDTTAVLSHLSFALPVTSLLSFSLRRQNSRKLLAVCSLWLLSRDSRCRRV